MEAVRAETSLDKAVVQVLEELEVSAVVGQKVPGHGEAAAGAFLLVVEGCRHQMDERVAWQSLGGLRRSHLRWLSLESASARLHFPSQC